MSRAASSHSPRYAIYVRPPESDPLTALADRWLGRSPAGRERADTPPIDGLDPAVWWRWVEAPRTYGFHGTLKPPFRLADGRAVAELETALGAFAATRRPFETAPLEVRRIGRFLALAVADPSVDELAAACVERFDGFRRPAAAAELARRRARNLSARQDALLCRWGYPYVMEEFRFHMTLTGALAPDELVRAEGCVADYFARQIGCPLHISDVCLFEQSAPDAPFRMAARLPFGGGR